MYQRRPWRRSGLLRPLLGLHLARLRRLPGRALHNCGPFWDMSGSREFAIQVNGFESVNISRVAVGVLPVRRGYGRFH